MRSRPGHMVAQSYFRRGGGAGGSVPPVEHKEPRMDRVGCRPKIGVPARTLEPRANFLSAI